LAHIVSAGRSKPQASRISGADQSGCETNMGNMELDVVAERRFHETGFHNCQQQDPEQNKKVITKVGKDNQCYVNIELRLA